MNQSEHRLTLGQSSPRVPNGRSARRRTPTESERRVGVTASEGKGRGSNQCSPSEDKIARTLTARWLRAGEIDMTDSKDRDAQLFDELLRRHGGAGLATGLRYYPFDRQGVSVVILEMGLPPLRPNVFPQIQKRMARSDDRNAPIFLMETYRLESLLRER